MGAFLAVGPFTIDALWRQTVGMRQVPIFAQKQRVACFPARIAGEGFDPMQQGIPGGGADHGSGPLANFNLQIEFWHRDDHRCPDRGKDREGQELRAR